LEVLDLPNDDEQILVLPFLRPFNSPTFDTFGEAIDCFRQLFEVPRLHARTYYLSRLNLLQGLQFLHEHHIAHRYVARSTYCIDIDIPRFRDPNMNNFMMEWRGMFPDGFHPQAIMRTKEATGTASSFTRTQRPTRYIIVDFGMSSRYDPNDASPREKGLIGGDKTVPEFLNGQPYHDPYKADIYYVGNLIRTEFMEVRLLLLHALFPHTLS